MVDDCWRWFAVVYREAEQLRRERALIKAEISSLPININAMQAHLHPFSVAY
jgi:hypothetical protein